MKKLLFGMMVLAFIVAVPIQAIAKVGVSVSLGLPLLSFSAPPHVVVLPDTDDVYVAPDIDVDLFFWSGWWWRPWQGRWYRSQHYDRGWVRYGSVPRFYFDVDPGWRGHYRNRNWYGHPWYYERIDNRRLQRQWHRWHANRHWQKRDNTWGVWKYQSRQQHQRQELRRQRERQYRERPEVRQHQQQRRQYQKQQQRRQPQVQRSGRQPRERVRQPQR